MWYMRHFLPVHSSPVGGSFISLCRGAQIYGPETIRLYICFSASTLYQHQCSVWGSKSYFFLKHFIQRERIRPLSKRRSTSIYRLHLYLVGDSWICLTLPTGCLTSTPDVMLAVWNEKSSKGTWSLEMTLITQTYLSPVVHLLLLLFLSSCCLVINEYNIFSMPRGRGLLPLKVAYAAITGRMFPTASVNRRLAQRSGKKHTGHRTDLLGNENST